ncbi:MAG TPA: ATP-binding protein [Polyangiaceae bacterium]|nr:ATP-binding protein [Polyangiaceae bacterium]
MMEPEFEKALAVLQRYISPVNARSILVRAIQQQGCAPATLTAADLRKCGANLRRGVELFVDADRRAVALREIDDLCGNGLTDVAPSIIRIAAESDIGRARAEARKVCDAVGASPFAMQKVATIVSELTRNMVLYASGGLVTIAPRNSGRKAVEIQASDEGPGIPKSKLDEIMGGRYRSRTGLGRGLLGTKQLADSFDISSDGTGTRVVASVWVQK